MAIKVGINGGGRIGRCFLRAVLKRIMDGDKSIEIVAVNDPFMSPEYVCYLLTHDSTHGLLPIRATFANNKINVGEYISFVFTAHKDPAEIPWAQLGAEFVVESTGCFTTKEKASAHLKGGAKKVVISAPSNDADTFVFGVNEEKYDPKTMHVVSNASCTTNCLAPLVKVIHDKYGVEKGFMSTIHAATATQKTVDGPSLKAWRDGRSVFGNIIPASTGAARAVGKVIPELNGKLTGGAYRVPTANVSVVDVTLLLKVETTLEEINATIKAAAEGRLKGVLNYVDEPVVSTDFNSTSYSSSYDKEASMGLGASGNFFKLVSWYDNEFGYSTRIFDLITYMAKKQ